MKIIEPKQITDVKIAIVVSRFNESITSKLLDGAVQHCKDLGLLENITVVHVPGAVEIPITLQRLAHQGIFDALIALGAVIRGETSHYDYVCNHVTTGCQTISLQNDIPVIFGVLTCDTDEQALDRVGGRHGHKGKDAVVASLQMISVLRQID